MGDLQETTLVAIIATKFNSIDLASSNNKPCLIQKSIFLRASPLLLYLYPLP